MHVQEWLSSINIKFYESKINLNWKPILKAIIEVRSCATLAKYTFQHKHLVLLQAAGLGGAASADSCGIPAANPCS